MNLANFQFCSYVNLNGGFNVLTQVSLTNYGYARGVNWPVRFSHLAWLTWRLIKPIALLTKLPISRFNIYLFLSVCFTLFEWVYFVLHLYYISRFSILSCMSHLMKFYEFCNVNVSSVSSQYTVRRHLE